MLVSQLNGHLAGVEGYECFFCEKQLERVNRCRQCKIAIYCGRECQRKDWPAHKQVCQRPVVSPAVDPAIQQTGVLPAKESEAKPYNMSYADSTRRASLSDQETGLLLREIPVTGSEAKRAAGLELKQHSTSQSDNRVYTKKLTPADEITLKCKFDFRKYEGEAIPHGKGKVTFKNGNTFNGNLKNGHVGVGKLSLSNRRIYEGEVSDEGVPHGKGELHFSNGSCFKGEFSEGEHIGGTVTLRNKKGLVHEGELPKTNALSGKNKPNCHNISNLRDLEGSVYEMDISLEDEVTLKYGFDFHEYKGEVIPHGEGTVTFTNGNIYKGIVESGHLGKGELTFPNGRKYKGEVSDEGVPHGQGEMLYPTGTRFEGEFSKGEPINGRLVGKDGMIIGEVDRSAIPAGNLSKPESVSESHRFDSPEEGSAAALGELETKQERSL